MNEVNHQRSRKMREITVFENHPKCHICDFQFWHFQSIFVLLKVTCLVTLFDRKLQVFKNWQFLAFLINFCLLKNVNIEWDFFSMIFKHCVVREMNQSYQKSYLVSITKQMLRSFRRSALWKATIVDNRRASKQFMKKMSNTLTEWYM